MLSEGDSRRDMVHAARPGRHPSTGSSRLRRCASGRLGASGKWFGHFLPVRILPSRTSVQIFRSSCPPPSLTKGHRWRIKLHYVERLDTIRLRTIRRMDPICSSACGRPTPVVSPGERPSKWCCRRELTGGALTPNELQAAFEVSMHATFDYEDAVARDPAIGPRIVSFSKYRCSSACADRHWVSGNEN